MTHYCKLRSLIKLLIIKTSPKKKQYFKRDGTNNNSNIEDLLCSELKHKVSHLRILLIYQLDSQFMMKCLMKI